MDACKAMCELDRNPVETIIRLKEYPSLPDSVKENAPDLFVYCSTPRAINDTEVSGGGHTSRPLYRNNTEKPVGMHSYYNIGWDPRVRRGDPLQTRKLKEQQECEKIRRKLIEPRKRGSIRTSGQEKSATRTSDPQTMIRTANLRYARLAISNLRPKEKVAFLVELTDELDQDELCYKGQRIGAAKLLPKVPSRKKNLVDNSTQILPGEFYNFDTEVVPIIERLVGSICYQARLEVLKETEQEAHQLEREMFNTLKSQEEAELRKYKARVEKNLKEEERQNALLAQQVKDEINGKTGVAVFGGVYVKYGTREAYKCMGEEFMFNVALMEAVQKNFTNWLNGQVIDKVTQYETSCKILDEMIRQVVAEREGQYAASMWEEVYREQPLRYSQDLEANVAPPPTPGPSANESEEEGDVDTLVPSNTPAFDNPEPTGTTEESMPRRKSTKTRTSMSTPANINKRSVDDD